MPSPVLLVAGRMVSARNLGLLLLRSSEALFTGCGRNGAWSSDAMLGENEPRSKVGEGRVKSIDGESAGVLAEAGSIGENVGRSCDRPYFL